MGPEMESLSWISVHDQEDSGHFRNVTPPERASADTRELFAAELVKDS